MLMTAETSKTASRLYVRPQPNDGMTNIDSLFLLPITDRTNLSYLKGSCLNYGLFICCHVCLTVNESKVRKFSIQQKE